MSSSCRLWVINPSPSMSRVPWVALIGRLRPYSRLLRSGTYIVLKKTYMAKLQKNQDIGKLKVQHSRCGGIDVGATLMQVCISVEDSRHGSNRSFGTDTQSLRDIVKWLLGHGITHVAMESTGVYWIPLFNMLVKNGIEAILVNPADVKNYTARKTEVNDAAWLMTLMSYDLVKPSFQTDRLSRALRNCTRQRMSLVSICSDCIRRMQKTMELMNIKLTEVISDIAGPTGIRIIEAILGGNTSPRDLAALASDKCKSSKEEIARALEGTWDDELIFILGQHYRQYQLYREQTMQLDSMIECKLKLLVERILKMNGGEMKTVIRSRKATPHRKNRISFDIEALSVQIWGVNLMRIDGVSGITLLTLMGELGCNFVSSFKDAAHFCSWCNLSPDHKITGGRIISSKMKKRVNPVGLMLRNCAQTLSNSNSPLGDYYRRMRGKGGGKYAVCATAHKIAAIIYTRSEINRNMTPLKSVSTTDSGWRRGLCIKR